MLCTAGKGPRNGVEGRGWREKGEVRDPRAKPPIFTGREVEEPTKSFTASKLPGQWRRPKKSWCRRAVSIRSSDDARATRALVLARIVFLSKTVFFRREAVAAIPHAIRPHPRGDRPAGRGEDRIVLLGHAASRSGSSPSPV